MVSVFVCQNIKLQNTSITKRNPLTKLSIIDRL